LPERTVRAGYAEVVKYGLVHDAAFFGWCREHGGRMLLGHIDDRIYAIKKSCAHKAKIVSEDERESGRRALLNLGHTFAHALEGVTGYSDRLMHGEAVAIGIAMAFALSAEMGLCSYDDADTVREHLHDIGLPVKPPMLSYDIDQIMALMAQDKKAKNGRLTMILVRGIGQAFIADDVDEEIVRAFWRKSIV
jgi:3-dehydroquinate synthase